MEIPKAKKPKKYHRIRAHRNPLSDWVGPHPESPEAVDWTTYFPDYASRGSQVEFVDIGCGYGGLTVALGRQFPDKLVVGMEIRDKVVQYVDDRIRKLRAASVAEGKTDCSNCSVILTNAMKFLPNFFRKAQLSKMFFLFPDPHFKKSNHRRRIISTNLLSDYAYVLRPGGLLYTVTDVRELFDWETQTLDAHPLFERVPEDQLTDDPCVPLALNSSEEAHKVEKSTGSKWIAVYRRKHTEHTDPPAGVATQ